MPDGTIPDSGGLGDLQQLINLFGSIFGTSGNSNNNSTSPEGLAAGMQLMPILLSMLTSQDYSPDAAERDSKPAVDLILRQMMEQGIPGISGAEGAAGAYNSTTAALMKNDLAARGAAEGAALVAKNKATYGALRTGQANSIIGLINSLINANRNTRTNTTTPNLASNPAARNAALAGLAAGAARNLTKPQQSGGAPRARPRAQEPLQGVETSPETLFNMLDPQGQNFETPDDLPDGPTPQVDVTNTGNSDIPDGASSGLDGSEDGGALGGVDLLDLGNLGGDFPDITLDPISEPDPIIIEDIPDGDFPDIPDGGTGPGFPDEGSDPYEDG